MFALAEGVAHCVCARVAVVSAIARLDAAVGDGGVRAEPARCALRLCAWVAIIQTIERVGAAPRDELIEAGVVRQAGGVDARIRVGGAVDSELAAVRDLR